ncbi:apolipoprotein A-II [Athene noctua]|uniref:apolipoprotein A-II n=1 Tax=Athene noctua TaxID=126797 RepID=UPI003EBC6B77
MRRGRPPQRPLPPTCLPRLWRGPARPPGPRGGSCPGGYKQPPRGHPQPRAPGVLPRPPSPAEMKLLAAALLLPLLCAGRLQAAVVRREAAETIPAAPEAEPDVNDYISRYFPLFSVFTKDLPQRLQAEELRSQAEAYFDRANKQLAPLAQELRSNIVNLFSSVLDLGKGEGQA